MPSRISPGSIVVPDSVTDPLGYYFNNTVKSHALIRTAIRNKVGRFIFSSTAAVYGDAKDNPIRKPRLSTRSRPTGPRSS